MNYPPNACRRGMLQLIAPLVCLSVGGCGLGEWWHNGMKVGPNYTTPPAPVAAQWIDYQRPEAKALSEPADVRQWWRIFDDSVLNSLISDAYGQNLSLRTAGERIAEARAVRG